ncbi:MAG: hypothetical protein ACI9G1_002047 [Pirellulaceae bacterium]|jgi:hypothetical protein
MEGNFAPGKPVDSGTYASAGYSVTVEKDGAIKVKPNDWISKYSKCLYGDAMVGWSDFGRMTGGSVSPLADPNSICAGETLYHIPTYTKNTGRPSQPVVVHDAADAVLRETWIGIGIKGRRDGSGARADCCGRLYV